MMAGSELTRREALLTLGVGSILATSCSFRNSGEASRNTNSDEDLFLNKFGFGPNKATFDEIRSLGFSGWIKSQLDAPKDEPLWLQQKLWQVPLVHLSPWELRDWPQEDVYQQLQQVAILRAVYTPWQVRERLVRFWSDHFNIFAKKGLGAYRIPLAENQTIRPHALGNFGEMLRASAQSSGMLVFLDQQASNQEHPNENYARELLELHSLGVEAGYSQQDVIEVARCFTGWTEERGFLRAKGAFKFDETLHDPRSKTVLGYSIPAGGGVNDGLLVLEILSNHPATAHHIANKFAKAYFGGDSAKVAPLLEKEFLASKGNIRQMVQAACELDSEFLAPNVAKRPFDFLVSTIRSLNLETEGKAALQKHLISMGQPLYQWPMPDGYPVDTESWKGNLLARWNFALDLTSGKIPGTDVPKQDGFTSYEIALQFCDPAFQWR